MSDTPAQYQDPLRGHSLLPVSTVRACALAGEPYDADGPFGEAREAGADESRPGPRPLSLGMVLRFKRLIVVVALVVAVPIITLIWTFAVTKYRVEAQIRVRPIIPRLVFRDDEKNGPVAFYQQYMNTQVSVILSPTVLQRVLDQPEIRKTQWFQEKLFTLSGKPPSPMDRLRKAVEVYPRGMTEVIDIAMVDRHSADAALIVNAILDQYLKVTRETANQTDDLIYQQLMAEYNSLRGEIEGREAQIAKLRKDLGSALPEELLSQRRVRLDEMEGRLGDLRRQMATNQWQIKELGGLLQRTTTGPARSLGNNPRYEEDAEWRRMYIDVRTARHQMEVEKDRLGESHPTMVELRKRVTLAEELLKSREAQLDAQARLHPGLIGTGGEARSEMTRDIESLEQQNRLFKYQEQVLVGDLKRLQADFDRTFDSAQTLAREIEALNYKRELYRAVRNRVDQKEMERNVPGSIEILSRAMVPTEPHRDRRILMSLMALMAGLGAGVGLALVRATTTQTIHEPADILATIRTPFLGQLPLLTAGAEQATLDSPVQAEYIRMVRTALLQRLDGARGGTIMVTSAGPQAGKTTVAVLLAKSLAQCGKKVLLVDADLRNPSIAAKFGVDPGPGLVGALTARGSAGEAIVATDHPRLSILPASRTWNVPEQELLANGTFAACLDRWRRRFDVILFDTPPILPVADARIVSRQMDGTILVVREGHCRRADVAEALAYLGAAGGKLVGTVFIGAPRKRNYGPSYYDQYTPSPEGEPEHSSS